MKRYPSSLPVLGMSVLVNLVPLSSHAQETAPVSIPAPAVEAIAVPSTETSTPLIPRTIKFNVMQKGTGVPLRKVEVKAGDKIFFSSPDGVVEVLFESSIKEFTFVRNSFETLTLNADEFRDTLELDVYLYPRLGADDEVIVKGKRRPSVSKKVISAVEAARVAPAGDPGQVTKIMPGVTSQTGRSNITIRGSEPDDSIYRIDDIEVPFIYHSVGQLTVIPPSMIEDVEFSSGGFGAEYGDSTGGVVVVRTKNEIPERPITRFTLNLPIYSSVYHERPLSESTGMSVGVRRSYLDKILPRVLPKDSGITLIPYFTDYQGTWIKKEDDGHKKLTLLASVDGVKASIPSDFSNSEDGSAKFNVRTYYGVVAFERSLKLNSDWTAQATPQLVYTDAQFNVNDVRFRVRAHNYRLPIEFSKRISSTEKLYTGVELSHTPYTINFFLPRFDPDDPFYDFEEAPREEGNQTDKITRVATWLTRDFQLNSFLITPGARLFYMNQNKQADVDPRLALRYAVTNSTTAKAATGKYSQFPRRGEASPGYGNTDLRFPFAIHYILGLETKWDDRWDTDIQTFYKDVRNLIRNDSETRFNNNGQLRSHGYELFVRRALSERWFGWLAYTWSKTEERNNSAEKWRLGDNDQTHVVHLAGSYTWTPTWETGGRLTSHTGDTYTSKVGPAVYNTNLDKYQPRQAADVANNARLPHYNELSLFSSHDFLFDTSKLTFRWGVEYLWFKRPVSDSEANYDYSAAKETQGLPPIPYLELRGEL
jgi:hypothetical protein